jgi:hypothetical protein
VPLVARTCQRSAGWKRNSDNCRWAACFVFTSAAGRIASGDKHMSAVCVLVHMLSFTFKIISTAGNWDKGCKQGSVITEQP